MPTHMQVFMLCPRDKNQPIKAVWNLYSKWKVERKTHKHNAREIELLFF